MIPIKRQLLQIAGLILLPVVSAQVDFKRLPCSIINDIKSSLEVIVPTLVIIMFVYGGIKYVYSADDAGGRKQGKTVCIHALIGGMIFTLVSVVLSTLKVTWWGSC